MLSNSTLRATVGVAPAAVRSPHASEGLSTFAFMRLVPLVPAKIVASFSVADNGTAAGAQVIGATADVSNPYTCASPLNAQVFSWLSSHKFAPHATDVLHPPHDEDDEQVLPHDDEHVLPQDDEHELLRDSFEQLCPKKSYPISQLKLRPE